MLRRLRALPDRVIAGPGIRLFSVVRNEQLRLPYFLEHYRRLGVEMFFFIDNGSADGTPEFLVEQDDVYLLRADGRFGDARYGTDWILEALDAFGRDRWCVVADVDELLIYPGSEHFQLRELSAFLEKRGETALYCILLDMYGSGPIAETEYHSKQSPLEVCAYFDPDTHRLFPGSEENRLGEYPHFLYGGMRERVFGVRPCLNKVSFFENRPGTVLYPGAHFLAGSRISRRTIGAVLHFKYFSDFPARVKEEATRGERYQKSEQYVRYSSALEANPLLSAYYDGARIFISTVNLAEVTLPFRSRLETL